MHATEHSDRFTVVLPNGQPMDVFKADLRPETAAELRSMVVPAMATRGDVTGAELDAIEEQAKELEDGGWAPMVTYDPKAERAARYGAGDERDAGTLADGLSLDGSVPVPAGDTYVSETPDALAARERAARLAAIPSPRDTYLARNSALNAVADELTAVVGPPDVFRESPPMPTVAAPRPASMLNWSNSLPDSLPGIGFPVAPEMVNMTSALHEQPDAVILTPEQAKTAGERGADVPIDVPPPEKGFAARQGAPAAPAAPPTDPDAELKARFKAFASGGSRGAPQISVRGVAERDAAPFAMPASYDEAIKQQYDLNERSAKLQADTAAEVERLSTEKGIKEQQMLDRDNAQSAEETRRLDQMREEAFNGKIDVNRAFDRMDGGQRALSLIGLLLGGIGAGNTGVNAAVGVMERMIDRDIDAQAKDLGRKQTAYSNAIQQGYHAEQARQRARLEAMSVLQGSIDRAAMKNGSERALLAGQAANAALSAKVATDTMAMQDKHLERQRQEINSEYDREFKNLTLKAKYDEMRQSREAAALAAAAAMLKARGAEEKLSVTLPDGRVVVATDPTARSDLSRKQTAHQEFVKGLNMLDEMRRKNPGGTVVPAWLSWMGFSDAEASAAGGSLASAVRLAYLKAQGAGAYDKGSGELSVGIIQDPTSFFGTGDDKNYLDITNKLRTLANSSFLATITANTRGGNVYEIDATPIGAE